MGSGDDGIVELLIEARRRDIGGFGVKRILPFAKRRMVGPFIFLDEMGPVELPAGQGIDVPPHPHIGLATVTYLFAGEIIHRDSLGVVQAIRPGAVNWMTAGRGIVHSERSGEAERAAARPLHGLQSWVALPLEQEEAEPAFSHHAAEELPQIEGEGYSLRLIAGRTYGESAPVAVYSDLFYLHGELQAGARLSLPEDQPERAVYVVEGGVELGGRQVGPGSLAVVKPGGAPGLTAVRPSRVMLLGGAPLEGRRHIWWNFVSSRPEHIEQAKADWRAGRFAAVPGETEFVPLPEGT